MVNRVSSFPKIPQVFINAKNKFTEFDKKLDRVACAAFKELKELFSNVISETYKFMKNHKLLSVFVITDLISIYRNVFYAEEIILYAIPAVHETISYFTSTDYKFKCTTKKFIKSIENLQKHCRNGEVRTNDLEFGKASAKMAQLRQDLYLCYTNAKNQEQMQHWKKYFDQQWQYYLKNINPNLIPVSESIKNDIKLPKTLFAKTTSIISSDFNEILFNSFKNRIEKIYIEDIHNLALLLHGTQDNLSEKMALIKKNEKIFNILGKTKTQILTDLEKKLAIIESEIKVATKS